jgi:hypothetical protein
MSLDMRAPVQVVIVGSHMHIIACIDMESGERLWTTRLDGRVEGPAAVRSRVSTQTQLACAAAFCAQSAAAKAVQGTGPGDCPRASILSSACARAGTWKRAGTRGGDALWTCVCAAPVAASLSWAPTATPSICCVQPLARYLNAFCSTSPSKAPRMLIR